ncbi:unnamed protein product, partial [Ixodes pacificus]
YSWLQPPTAKQPQRLRRNGFYATCLEEEIAAAETGCASRNAEEDNSAAIASQRRVNTLRNGFSTAAPASSSCQMVLWGPGRVDGCLCDPSPRSPKGALADAVCRTRHPPRQHGGHREEPGRPGDVQRSECLHSETGGCAVLWKLMLETLRP